MHLFSLWIFAGPGKVVFSVMKMLSTRSFACLGSKDIFSIYLRMTLEKTFCGPWLRNMKAEFFFFSFAASRDLWNDELWNTSFSSLKHFKVNWCPHLIWISVLLSSKSMQKEPHLQTTWYKSHCNFNIKKKINFFICLYILTYF